MVELCSDKDPSRKWLCEPRFLEKRMRSLPLPAGCAGPRSPRNPSAKCCSFRLRASSLKARLVPSEASRQGHLLDLYDGAIRLRG